MPTHAHPKPLGDRKAAAWGLACLLCAALAGCGPKDPLDTPVDAGDTLALSMWRAQVSDRFSSEQWTDFDEAMREIKYQIMAEGTLTGAADITAEALDRIHGHTMREAMSLGLNWEHERVEKERNELMRVVDRNARLRTNEDDLRSQHVLEEIRDHQLQRLREANADLRRIEQRMSADGIAVPGTEAATVPVAHPEPVYQSP